MKSTPSRGKSGMGGHKKSSKSSGHPHEIRIRRGKSGGHIVSHHHLPDETGAAPMPEEHVMPDQASLLQHIAANTDNAPAPQAPPPDAAQGGGAAQPPPGM